MVALFSIASIVFTKHIKENPVFVKNTGFLLLLNVYAGIKVGIIPLVKCLRRMFPLGVPLIDLQSG